MAFFEIAGEVIEAWVRENHPEDDEFRWLPRVPATDWQYTRVAWRSAATVIVADFNARIDNPVTMPAGDKDVLHKREMQDFQTYLALKAEGMALTARIRAMLA